MRHAIRIAAAGVVAILLTGAAAAGNYPAGYGASGSSYGASYGGQAGWDVPPVPLNMPDAQPGADGRGWRDHDHSAGYDHHPVDRGYARLERGYSMPHFWMSPEYQVSNWGFYGLSQPPRGCRWVRYYDEAVLVDEGGRVLQMIDDLDWDQPMAGNREVISSRGGQMYGGMAPGSYYAPPPPEPRMAPPPPVPVGPPPPLVWRAPGTVVVQSGPVVTTTTTTTTTTTYVEEVARAPNPLPRPVAHRVWHRPVRRVVSCCCLCTR